VINLVSADTPLGQRSPLSGIIPLLPAGEPARPVYVLQAPAVFTAGDPILPDIRLFIVSVR